MKIFLNGKIKEVGVLEDVILEVIDGVAKQLDIPKDTEIALENLEFKVMFNIDGKEQYATVPREVNGEVFNELLMVSVHLDELGNIISAEDNEKESFYDSYTLAKAMGADYDYQGTESRYIDGELIEQEVLTASEDDKDGVKAIRYIEKDNPLIEVVRHYKGDLLVAEYVYKPKNK